MARLLRFAPADVPQHIWCRGNQQQDVFHDDWDRRRYLELLIRHATEFGVAILGYCEMTNHVHLVLEPSSDDGLSRMMARLNSEHAQTVQFRAQRAGHLWQHRFHSAAMDRSYLWMALRYVELNPVRAGMVRRPEDWAWSSAAAHLRIGGWPEWLDRRKWLGSWDADGWAQFLGASVTAEEAGQIRQATRRDRPLAAEAVVRRWETDYAVELLPRKAGPPMRMTAGKEGRQLLLFRSAVG